MIKKFDPQNLSKKPPGTSVLKLFLRISPPIILLSALLISLLHYGDFCIKMNVIKAREISRIHIGTESIRRQFGAITSDLRYLATSGYLLDFLAHHKEEEKEILAREFLAITRTKGIYDQIRYLDKRGKEVVRVNRNVDSPFIVPDDELQDKGNRYYFRDTMEISCREVFVSPLDLNIEKGEIERPLKPMIRFGMPVCDRQGEKQGMVLFNYLGAQLLGSLKEMLQQAESHPMLLNNDGFWFLSQNPEDEWGFMFLKDLRFQNRYPDSWEVVQRDQNGQITTDAGIFTFHRIYPLEEGQASSAGSFDTSSLNSRFIEARNYYWVLVLHIPGQQISQRIHQHISKGAVQFLLSMMFLLPLTWMFCMERVRAATAREAVKRSREFTWAVTSQLAEGLMVLDSDARVQMLNPKAERLLGWKETELLSGGVKPVLPEFELGKKECKISECIEKGVSHKIEPFYFYRKTGGKLPVSLSAAPMYTQGTIAGAILTFQDITRRLEIEEKLKAMATLDPLTGTKNRGELERLLTSELERCKRYDRSFSLLMIDIDHFKKINDTYGHQCGDQVLKNMCRYIDPVLRENDILGRYGGEEFVVMLPETDLSSAESFAVRMNDGIRQNSGTIGAGKASVTVSIGVAAYPDHGSDLETVLKQADDALYAAKEQGRDRVITAS